MYLYLNGFFEFRYQRNLLLDTTKIRVIRLLFPNVLDTFRNSC